MSQLTLKYTITLVSDIGRRATEEAKVLEKAQQTMQKATEKTSDAMKKLEKEVVVTGVNIGGLQGVITGTTSKFVDLDRAMSKVGGNVGSRQQITFFNMLKGKIDQATTSASKLRESLSKPLAEGGGTGADKGGRGSSLMSDVQRMAGIVGAARLARTAFDDNMEFEKLQLKMKFNAQLSSEEVQTLRQDAIGLSKTSLNKPLDVAKAQFRLANAGLKMDSIRKLTPTVANAAQVFDATPDQIADLVFDMVTKSGVKEERVPAMLDMLYSHATSGRFETMDMARQAPAFLNSAKTVGITGERGLNFMGALTQRMMRNATVTNPSEVSTIIQEGLAHITTPHMTGLDGKKHSKGATGLMGFGINVADYFDEKGNFKGDGGVDGIVDLARAMKSKHLDNPFMMGQAGIREHYTQLFWREMMNSIDAPDTDKDPNLLKMMERGGVAQNSGQLAKNLEDVKASGFGKMQAVGVNTQGAMVGGFGETVTAGAANTASWASNHPWLTAGGALLGAGATLATGGLAGPWVIAALAAAAGTAGLGAGQAYLSDSWAKKSPQDREAERQLSFSTDVTMRKSGLNPAFAFMPPTDFLTLTAPGALPTQLAAGKNTEIKVGEGTLSIDVRVSDDRVSASSSVLRPLSLVRINAGATNPGGFKP
jgi:hypothetical protein